MTPISIGKIIVGSNVGFYWYLKKLSMYHLKSCCVPLMVYVPQVENHWFTSTILTNDHLTELICMAMTYYLNFQTCKLDRK